MKKLLVFILTLLTLTFAVFPIACKNNQSSNPPSNPPSSQEPEVELTDKKLVSNGKSDYKIVIPQNASSQELKASNELVNYFKEATGITLPVISDASLTFETSSKYVSVGNTNLITLAELTVDYDALDVNGVGIYTKDSSIFLIGGKENGIIYTAYDFLYYTLGFEQFFNDCYSLNKVSGDLYLPDLNITDAPDIKRNLASIGYLIQDKNTALKMKSGYTQTGIYGSPVGSGLYYHNTLTYVPISQYLSTREDWFSTDKDHLCFTARGNATLRAEMLQVCFENFIEAIKEGLPKGITIYPFVNMDKRNWCHCQWCDASKTHYDGSDAAVYIQFSNELYDKIANWFATDPEGQYYYENYNGEDFRLMLSAYQQAKKAPARLNQTTGEYEPIDDSVVLRDGMFVECAIIETDWGHAVTDTVNKSIYDDVKKWSALSKQISMWSYNTQFLHYLMPFDSFNVLQDNFKFFKEVSAVNLFDQSQHNQGGGATGWHVLKTYLTTKLAWDVDADLEALTNKFFDNYFGEASVTMRKFYDNYRNFSAYQQNVLLPKNFKYDLYCAYNNSEYWPKHILDGWMNYIDQALKDIEHLKNSQPERYDMLYKHIALERISVEYMLVTWYANSYSDADILNIKRNLKADIELNKLTVMFDSTAALISDYVAGLGV